MSARSGEARLPIADAVRVYRLKRMTRYKRAFYPRVRRDGNLGVPFAPGSEHSVHPSSGLSRLDLALAADNRADQWQLCKWPTSGVAGQGTAHVVSKRRVLTSDSCWIAFVELRIPRQIIILGGTIVFPRVCTHAPGSRRCDGSAEGIYNLIRAVTHKLVGSHLELCLMAKYLGLHTFKTGH